MEIEQLKAFVTLAKIKNFSKSARILHIGQSAVSMRIASLEESLGVRLFQRNNRNVELTKAGIELMPYAERILYLQTAGIQKAKSAEVFDDQFSVGSTLSILQNLISPMIKEFISQHPNVSLTVQTGHSWEICERLLDHAVHLGFVFQPIESKELEFKTFYKDDIILIANRKLSLNTSNKLPLIDLSGDLEVQQWKEQYFSNIFISKLQVDQMSTLIDFIKEGPYLGFVPKKMVELDLKIKKLYEITLPKNINPITRTAFIVYHKKPKQKKGVQANLAAWNSLLKRYKFFTI